MSLDEFIEMMTEADLVDDHFGQREIGPLWALSMMTNRHELTSDRHLSMSFVEFLEALARCADKFSLQYIQDDFPNFPSRNPYQLDTKLQATILRLLRVNLTPKQYESILNKYRDQIET